MIGSKRRYDKVFKMEAILRQDPIIPLLFRADLGGIQSTDLRFSTI